HLGEVVSRRMTRRNRRTPSRSRPVGTTELLGKGFSIQEALSHGARNLHRLDVSADEFALVDLGARSLGPAPDPRNRHALILACTRSHSVDGGGRVPRSGLVRFGRRASSTSANDAAGDQCGYSAVLSLRARAVFASGLEMPGLEMSLRTGRPMPTRASIGR